MLVTSSIRQEAGGSAPSSHQETVRLGSENVVAIFGEAGLIGPSATRLWRRPHARERAINCLVMVLRILTVNRVTT